MIATKLLVCILLAHAVTAYFPGNDEPDLSTAPKLDSRSYRLLIKLSQRLGSLLYRDVSLIQRPRAVEGRVSSSVSSSASRYRWSTRKCASSSTAFILWRPDRPNRLDERHVGRGCERVSARVGPHGLAFSSVARRDCRPALCEQVRPPPKGFSAKYGFFASTGSAAIARTLIVDPCTPPQRRAICACGGSSTAARDDQPEGALSAPARATGRMETIRSPPPAPIMSGRRGPVRGDEPARRRRDCFEARRQYVAGREKPRLVENEG